MTTQAPVCWSRTQLQIATQRDVGGLELGNPVHDAIFAAVHQPVPIARLRRAGAAEESAVVSERDVLADFARQMHSNEPHLLFVTGKPGTGKSHLVRWLRSQLDDPSDWHIVYVEKRNTKLRRIIEQIISGIDTPKARQLRESMDKASERLKTVDEAMLTLLNHLHVLLEHDDEDATLAGISGATLKHARQTAARLVGEYEFKRQLSRHGGPIHRITELAMTGSDATHDIDEKELHLGEDDLLVEPDEFLETGERFQGLIRTLLKTHTLRRDVAAVIDHYLARAKAQVFTGATTDLLDVFQEVRRVLAARGQQLCLFIEDLVLLHGIDTQLAQALTVPAGPDLCRIRAAIAVTTGYLEDVTTFADRGVHYSMDLPRSTFDRHVLRDFVGRYLNASRLDEYRLADARTAGGEIPNACETCRFDKARCHSTFGNSPAGHGLYPFNGPALDRLIALASPNDFHPRSIARQVIREPLEVAEDELARPGSFPSNRFAIDLSPSRAELRVEVRDALSRHSADPEQELSLRALFAQQPPIVDDDLREVANFFGIRLSQLAADDVEPDPKPTPSSTKPSRSEIDNWVIGDRALGTTPAQNIRRWILDAVIDNVRTGPHGLPVHKVGTNDWKVGTISVRFADIVIAASAGSGSARGDVELKFDRSDSDAVLLKGVLAAANGDLLGPNQADWFFAMQARLRAFEEQIVQAAQAQPIQNVSSALAILGVQSNIAAGKTAEEPAAALAAMLRPSRPVTLHPEMTSFANSTRTARERALTVLRDRLTARRGTGAITLFDAGAVLADLVPAARLRRLSEPFTGTREIVNAMQALNQAQIAAARKAWDGLRGELHHLSGLIDKDDDFTSVTDAMDKFVTAAHNAGLLPEQEARNQYQALRQRVVPEALPLFRKLMARMPTTATPESLWDVAVDPTQNLRDLDAYWRECDRLLRAVEERQNPTPSNPADYDRQRLYAGFRKLADTLEDWEQQRG